MTAKNRARVLAAGILVAMLATGLAPARAQLSIQSGERRVHANASSYDGNTTLVNEDEIEDRTLTGPYNESVQVEQYQAGGAISEFGRSSASLNSDFSNWSAGSFRAFGTTTAHAETINTTAVLDPNNPPYNSATGESYVYTIFELGSQMTDYNLTASTFNKVGDGYLTFALVGLTQQDDGIRTYYTRATIARLNGAGTATGTLDPVGDSFDRYEVEVYSRSEASVESDGLGGFETKDSRQDFDFSFNLTPTAVPEPGTMTLMGLGLAGLIGAGRRKRKSEAANEDATL